MQRLSEKLASLNRFLAKSSERSLPFFNILKNITNENKYEYRWTEEAEESFQQMKKLILDLPSLTPPWLKETLYAYFAISTETVSAVLLTDRKGRQCPVQYVSKTLNKAERNYAPIEKLALSLIHMTKRLRRYFEVVELGAYNISFVPRNAMKGQILADVLSEGPEGEKEELYIRMPKAIIEKDDVKSWILFTDRASSLKGSGRAECEALLAGLRIARQMNISNIEVKVNSKLVASQINGNYEASKDSMIKYLAKAKEYASSFTSFLIENIPMNMNQKADVLSKLASVAFNHLTKEVLVEVLNKRSTEGQEVHTMVEEKKDNWMTPIIRCLEEGTWLKDKNEARCLRAKIGQYTMESEVLFKKGCLVPMLRCVGPLQASYVIREIHMGSCGMHVGPLAVVRKAIKKGYYWPTMHEYAKKEVEKCDSCQIHALVPRLPKTLMMSIMAPWPFYQWGMDILGSLPLARGGAKFVIVAIDYFTKWIEAKPLVKITVAHPQANGLVDWANKSLIEGIKTRIGREKAGWVDELPNVLWAHQTSIKQSNGETPFSLTYGSGVVISTEIGISTYRTLMIKEEYNEEEMRLNLDLLRERRETDAIRGARYKTKMEQYYNKKVHPLGFRPGEFMFQRNEASRVEDQGKLGPKWEGSYRVVEAGWAKGLAEERFEEDLLELMSRMENFDAYADKKMYVEYDKVFEKRYPLVEKISYDFRHTVFDLLKVYPDSPLPERAPPSKPSTGNASLSSASDKP
nr:reverse transcriptase domain-containing protein [Tanacetum cinerariifolium]